MNRHRLPVVLAATLATASLAGLGLGAGIASATNDSVPPTSVVVETAPPSVGVDPVPPATGVDPAPPATVQPPTGQPAVVDPVVTTDDGVVRTITVVGNGTITVAPDTATIEVGVETVAPTGGEVMATLGTDSETLLQSLIDQGIAEEDIQTSSINLYPQYDENGQAVTGYNGSLTMSVRVDDLESVGPTLDILSESVGDNFRINGLYFSYSDPESVLDQPRLDAIAQAEHKAGVYAGAVDGEVGEVLSISEVPGSTPVLFRQYNEMAAADSAVGAPAVSVSPGQLEFSVQVTVTFALS